MSAWSEAVWVVKQMEKQFKANGEIIKYQDKINDLILLLNELRTELDAKTAQLNQLQSLSSPIISSSVNGSPSSYTGTPEPGALWFISSE